METRFGSLPGLRLVQVCNGLGRGRVFLQGVALDFRNSDEAVGPTDTVTWLKLKVEEFQVQSTLNK